MMIPGFAPWTPEPEKVRPVFRRLRELKEQAENILGAPLPQLSIGITRIAEAIDNTNPR